MADVTIWFSPTYKPPAPKPPKPGEQLWSLRKGDHVVRCELRDFEHAGVEAQLWRDGEFYAGRLLKDWTAAIKHAERTRQRLESYGWNAE